MSDKGIEIIVTNGDDKVKITNSGYGLELYSMRNGWQWSGIDVDGNQLDMIVECIENYRKHLRGE